MLFSDVAFCMHMTQTIVFATSKMRRLNPQMISNYMCKVCRSDMPAEQAGSDIIYKYVFHSNPFNTFLIRRCVKHFSASFFLFCCFHRRKAMARCCFSLDFVCSRIIRLCLLNFRQNVNFERSYSKIGCSNIAQWTTNTEKCKCLVAVWVAKQYTHQS